MKTAALTIHIIIQNRNDLADRHSFFVHLEGIRMIERLRRIISTRTNEKAMMFALTKGRMIDPGEVNPVRKMGLSNGVNGSNHLILTKNGAYWDLM